ncbi:MAG TPA: bifunctional response regulator/alkaline phosphatase family protein [Candidatus Eisenbacteria bacterium]|nr:bifunctional response regulator/alkaline phosphatase family protein [Candidatus Eisenbacteria bacterium]
MAPNERKILWADDEIELLRAHILFLEEKGYRVTPVSNGEDALASTLREKFDAVLLDESMPGKGGLETLESIKEHDPGLPVILVTKNEAESLMDEAIGRRISDYLLKPVRPMQIFLALKRLLDGDRLHETRLARDYVAELARARAEAGPAPDWRRWIEIHSRSAQWDVELDAAGDAGLRQAHADQRREMNVEFCQYVEANYESWTRAGADAAERPPLSVDVVERWVAPHLKAGKRVTLVVIDCMRLDQWLTVEPILRPYFDIALDHQISILPTATPYSRNAIFSGLFPDEIQKQFPEFWQEISADERSKNRFERQLLEKLLERLSISVAPGLKYLKVSNVEEASHVRRNVVTFQNIPLVAMVFNFLDMLTHGRSESDLLKELAPDESAFRSVMRSWFNHSALFDALKWLSKQDGVVIVTTDHGAVLSRRSSLVYGNRETSTNLRFKYGVNLGCDARAAVHVKDPTRFRLPADALNKHYIVAKEDFYFIYPTKFHEYENRYRGSFQHGGISLDEMILPVATLTPRG